MALLENLCQGAQDASAHDRDDSGSKEVAMLEGLTERADSWVGVNEGAEYLVDEA